MIVEVYRNLRRQCWSIRDPKTGKVFDRVPEIVLQDVSFHVSKAGRERVLREKRKNVHAYVKGTVIATKHKLKAENWNHISYNPYLRDHFVIKGTELKVTNAEFVYLNDNGKLLAQP